MSEISLLTLVTWGPAGFTGVPCPLSRPLALEVWCATRRPRCQSPGREGVGGRARRVDAVWSGSFGACLVADAAADEGSVPWQRLLAYSLGAAWVWAS